MTQELGKFQLFGGFVFALQHDMTYLQHRLIRFMPDQDTITEVLVVLGMVTAMYFFSGAENLQTVKQQFSVSVSEASPSTIQK